MLGVSNLGTDEFQGLEKIVLARPDRIGDVIITSACLKPIQQAHPQCRTHLLLRRPLAPLFAEHPLLEAAIPIPEFEDSAQSDAAELTRIFKRHKFDCIVHLNHDPGIYLAAKRAGIRYRVGYGTGSEASSLTHAVEDKRSEGRRHEALYNLDLLRLLNIEAPRIFRPFISPSESAKRKIPLILPILENDRPYAALHLAAHGSKARMPVGVMAKIAIWLGRERHLDIVIVGTEVNDPALGTLKKDLPDNVSIWDLTGKTNLDELAWILSRAKVFLGRDSGPAHIAAAMGCPTVTIMGPHKKKSTSTRWAPLGERVGIVEGPANPRFFETARAFQQRYFSSIDVEEVKAEISELTGVPQRLL